MSPELQGLVEKATFNQQVEVLGAVVESGFKIDPAVLLDSVVNAPRDESVTTEQVLQDMRIFWN